MTDYIEQRREYVSRARSAFKEGEVQPSEIDYGTEIKWGRLRFAAAIILLAGFAYWHNSGAEIYECTSAKVIDMIEESRYDKFLQDYLKKGNIQ